jgi:putative transposase
MPRSARLVVPTLPHHVTHRGNRKRRTFFTDSDYRLYKKYLGIACAATGTSVWAWCLMPNHVHLVLVPSSKSGLAEAMRRTQGRYARVVNVREDRTGNLWQVRFASFVMDERHLLACGRYVELNPVRAGLVARAEDWPWSSARAHLCGEEDGLTGGRCWAAGERIRRRQPFASGNAADARSATTPSWTASASSSGGRSSPAAAADLRSRAGSDPPGADEPCTARSLDPIGRAAGLRSRRRRRFEGRMPPGQWVSDTIMRPGRRLAIAGRRPGHRCLTPILA